MLVQAALDACGLVLVVDIGLDTTVYQAGLEHYFNDSLFIELNASRSEIDLPTDLIINASNRIDTSDTTLGLKIGSRF